MLRTFLSLILIPIASMASPMQPININSDLKGGNETIKSPLGSTQLEAIIISGQMKIATLSGKNYQVGDRFDKFFVKDIFNDKVILDDRQTGEVIELRLGFSWPISTTN